MNRVIKDLIVGLWFAVIASFGAIFWRLFQGESVDYKFCFLTAGLSFVIFLLYMVQRKTKK